MGVTADSQISESSLIRAVHDADFVPSPPPRRPFSSLSFSDFVSAASNFKTAAVELSFSVAIRIETRGPELWRAGDRLRQLNSTLKISDIFNNTLGVYSAILDHWNLARIASSAVGAIVGAIFLYANQDMELPVGKTLFQKWKSALKNPDSPMFFGSSIGVPMAVPSHLSELYYGMFGNRPEQLLQLALGLIVDLSGVRFLLKYIRDETAKKGVATNTDPPASNQPCASVLRQRSSFGAFLRVYRRSGSVYRSLLKNADGWRANRQFVIAGRYLCKKVNEKMQSRHTGFAIGQAMGAFKVIEGLHVCFSQNFADASCMMTNIAIALLVGWGNKALTEMLYDKGVGREYFYVRWGNRMHEFPTKTRALLSAARLSMKELGERWSMPPHSTLRRPAIHARGRVAEKRLSNYPYCSVTAPVTPARQWVKQNLL